MQKANEFVNNLRSQSVQTRKTILVISSVLLTGAIFIFWIGTLSGTISNYSTKSVKAPDEKPFSLISNIVKDSYASAINGFKSTK